MQSGGPGRLEGGGRPQLPGGGWIQRRRTAVSGCIPSGLGCAPAAWKQGGVKVNAIEMASRLEIRHWLRTQMRMWCRAYTF